jgi:uncharacterized membrane protein
MYNILKFIHVTSIAVWFGGLVMLLLLNRVFIGAGDQGTAQAIGRQGGKFGTRLFLPALVVTLITGIGMVQLHDLGFGTPWVVWGIIGLVASMILGGVLTGATARKLAERVAAGTVDGATIAATQRRILMFTVINMFLLLSVIWAMVAKPS